MDLTSEALTPTSTSAVSGAVPALAAFGGCVNVTACSVTANALGLVRRALERTICLVPPGRPRPS